MENQRRTTAVREKTGNYSAGWLYFYVHFVTEVICFYMLGRYTGSLAELWFVALFYDMLAFVPQAIIGFFADRHPRFPIGVTGLVLLMAALLLGQGALYRYPSLILLCLGNACTHISGAEVTLRASGGRLGPAAIFVGGGSFGVISGKLLSGTAFPFWPLLLLAATAIPFVLYGGYYLREANEKDRVPCRLFRYRRESLPAAAVILLVVFVVVVRGYMGYGIPTSWNKTVFQTVLLFCVMGTGKLLGGVLADRFGVRKTALWSVALSLPFLMLGDEHIVVSLIGVMGFSMTMSITLALLVSALPETPGLAFGLTTIGLFLGTAPIFFFKLTTVAANCTVLAVLTLLCFGILAVVIEKDAGGDACV